MKIICYNTVTEGYENNTSTNNTITHATNTSIETKTDLLKKTYMEAMETCFRSFSTFLMLTSDWAQKIIASHEQSLYCQKNCK